MHRMQTVVVTGAGGFIGKNLCVRLAEDSGFDVRPIFSSSSREELEAALVGADSVVHLAGVNRPQDPAHFAGNSDSVATLTSTLRRLNLKPKIILSSSIRALEATPYGESKLASEKVLEQFRNESGSSVVVMRLPNVFGKWARPDYNSAVATFCHNIARGLPIHVDNPAAPITLLYIDDLIVDIMTLLREEAPECLYTPTLAYSTTVGEIVKSINDFHEGRRENRVYAVGDGLTRALYATYIATLPAEDFSYSIKMHVDPRGAFSEVLKTPASGQFSFLTAHPGVTRGGHYHHTKIEKFVVIRGEALFRFRHILSGEVIEIRTSGNQPTVVETIPGWTHDITNVGDDLMISLLWANEIFSPERPDTIAEEV